VVVKCKIIAAMWQKRFDERFHIEPALDGCRLEFPAVFVTDWYLTKTFWRTFSHWACVRWLPTWVSCFVCNRLVPPLKTEQNLSNLLKHHLANSSSVVLCVVPSTSTIVQYLTQSPSSLYSTQPQSTPLSHHAPIASVLWMLQFSECGRHSSELSLHHWP